MIYVSRQLFLIIFFLLLFICNVHAQITSTFNSNVEGWTAPNAVGNNISHITTGGNPGGFASALPDFVPAAIIPPFPVYFYFTAPASYLGNFNSYYNGNITFDLRQTTLTSPVVRPEVAISDGANSIYYFPTVPFNPPSSSWATYSVPLSASSGSWKTTPNDTGPPATQAQIQTILSNITYLGIRGRFNTVLSPGATSIDNVVLQPPITILTHPVTQATCAGTSITLTTVATGNNSLSYRWQQFVPGVGYLDLNNNAVYSGVTTAGLSINTSGGLGAGTYRCRVSGTNAQDAFTNAAVVTVNSLPVAPATTGNSNCGSGAVTLSASGGTAGQFRWYTVPTGGTAIPGQTNSSYTTPVISVTTNYYVSINNGTCESSRTLVVATINTPPTAPTTTGNSNCGSGAVTLSASGGTAGQYRWYTVASGGTALPGQTNATYTTPVISTTTNYYVSINNGTCESSRTLVVATINTPPTAPTTTGNSNCGSGAITLSASGGTAGQYRWYTVASGGTAIPGQTNATYTTPVISTTTNYYVSINNGTCESSRTLVVATINTPPTAPTTTGNSNCGSGAITLSASGGTAGQYRWYTVASGGTAIPGQTNATYTTPVISTTTNYYVSINNGTCESSRTLVVATINTPPTAPTTTGNSNCGSGAVTLSASGGIAGQYRWYTVASGGTAILGETSDTYTTPVIISTTTYYVSINNGICESARAAVIGTINSIPTPPITNGANSCTNASLTLSASGGNSGEYRWYDVPSGGSAIVAETNANFTTPVLTNTTTYYVAINTGVCESTREPVTATIGGAACTNAPPTITPSSTSITIAGVASFDLVALIADADGNLDLSTLRVVTQPSSEAIAQINNGILTVDYSGLSFAGTDQLTIEVCDVLGSCTQQELTIEVEGDVNVYNGISPNGDTYNEFWIIQNIASLPETRENRVTLFNRWGDIVFEVDNYDNDQNVFAGIGKNGDQLPSGVYFYKIDFKGQRETISGYLNIVR